LQQKYLIFCQNYAMLLSEPSFDAPSCQKPLKEGFFDISIKTSSLAQALSPQRNPPILAKKANLA